MNFLQRGTLSLAFVGSTVGIASAAVLQDRIAIHTKIVCDHCQKCPSCGKRIYDALHEVKGVRSVKIDPESNMVTVKYNGKRTDADKLREQLRATGFEADGQSPYPEAYEALDGCCKESKQ